MPDPERSWRRPPAPATPRVCASPDADGVRADLHQVVPVLRERGVTGTWLVVDQPEVERPVRREQLDDRVHRSCREIDHDPSAGVHRLAAQAAKIGERQDHDIRRRAARREPVVGVHEGDRVGHPGVRRIVIADSADGNEAEPRKRHDGDRPGRHSPDVRPFRNRRPLMDAPRCVNGDAP